MSSQICSGCICPSCGILVVLKDGFLEDCREVEYCTLCRGVFLKTKDRKKIGNSDEVEIFNLMPLLGLS